MKGITNSFQQSQKIRLDWKYYELCDKLINKLYGSKVAEGEFKLYDMLGDNDFRLIARKVKLGRLLHEFSPGGILNYYEDDFRFYLYSSSLVLNTDTPPGPAILPSDKMAIIIEMDKKMTSPRCKELEEKLNDIQERINAGGTDEVDERLLTIYQAVWQLLQSLKVMECSPVKMYDFYSLFHPFSILIGILETEMFSDDLRGNDDIYDFLHKISMTLHGTLRTDIQFFQIKDFNAIVHYAPAKLRAFYSMWALSLSDFYNKLSKGEHQYSFIFSPGLFAKTTVRQVKLKNKEIARLMLITVPERNLYFLRRMTTILAHEVSHFVSSRARHREERCEAWLAISVRILILELQRILYVGVTEDEWDQVKQLFEGDEGLYQEIKESVFERKQKLISEYEGKYNKKFRYHSEETIELIKQAYRGLEYPDIQFILFRYFYGKKNDRFSCCTQKEWRNIETTEYIKKWTLFFNRREEVYCTMFYRYQHDVLEDILKCMQYISREIFADIMGILTLDISPKEYILSFVGEETPGYNDIMEEKCGILEVRIGVVVRTIADIVSGDEFQGDNTEFISKWSQGIAPEMIGEFPNKSLERCFAAKIKGVLDDVRDCSYGINKYESIFNEQTKTFSNKGFDFFNDKVIRSELNSYAHTCAEYYTQTLNRNPDLYDKKRQLAQTHKVIAGTSAVDMLKEIVRFLFEYERNMEEIQENSCK